MSIPKVLNIPATSTPVALELEGTITGEHGIGLQKKHYLLKEHPDNIPVMKSIKRSLDVNNIMNPGKVFDLN